jgi:glutamine amidotransferase-like uncharacterized protein
MKNLIFTAYFILITTVIAATHSQQSNIIYIYQDDGVSAESLKHTVHAFHHLLKKEAVKTINAKQVKEGLWTQNARLFVMPGGADLPYAKKLNGEANDVIIQFVKNGGTFLGICAGAYYGSSHVEFDKNGPLAVVEKRELGFFPGKTIGPILAPYDYQTQGGSRAAVIHTIFPNNTTTRVFYNGGGFFQNAAQYPNTTILGTYDNGLPAIILINHGKGKVLLSGVHFEYTPSLLDANDSHIQKIIQPLRQNNPSRKQLFKNLMTVMGII